MEMHTSGCAVRLGELDVVVKLQEVIPQETRASTTEGKDGLIRRSPPTTTRSACGANSRMSLPAVGSEQLHNYDNDGVEGVLAQ